MTRKIKRDLITDLAINDYYKNLYQIDKGRSKRLKNRLHELDQDYRHQFNLLKNMTRNTHSKFIRITKYTKIEEEDRSN